MIRLERIPPHLLKEKISRISGPIRHARGAERSASSLRIHDPEEIVQKTAHNPATIYQIAERGFIREGYRADLTIIDPDTPHTVSPENILYHCGWSPFEGTRFNAWFPPPSSTGNLPMITVN